MVIVINLSPSDLARSPLRDSLREMSPICDEQHWFDAWYYLAEL